MASHLTYAESVLSGSVVANANIMALCKSVMGDHELDARGEGRWVFVDDRVVDACQYLETLPHVKGDKARGYQTLDLEPWQRFFVSELIGWVNGDTGERRYSHGILETGRKNGKTFLGSGFGLVALKFGGEGDEIYSAATKRDQAALVWERAGDMLAKVSPKEKGWKRTISKLEWGSRRFMPVSRESKTLDGLNPTLVLIDEAAAIQDPILFEVLETGMGSNDGLTLYMSTAQYRGDTPYTILRNQALADVQAGRDSSPVFAMVYALDTSDTWEDVVNNESIWYKANPNLDVSLRRDWLRQQVDKAERLPSLRPGLLIKNFCRWGSETKGWIPEGAWSACRVEKIERTSKLYLGVDLARKQDLCAITALWEDAAGTWWLDSWAWTTRMAFESAPESVRRVYQDAEDNGELVIIDEPVIPLERLYQKIMGLQSKHELVTVGIDPYFAHEIEARLESAGISVLRVGQSVAKLSSPTFRFEDMIASKRIKHEGNGFFGWQLSNVKVWTPPNGTGIKLHKQDEVSKIDCVVAAVIAAACIDYGEVPEGDMHIMGVRGDGTVFSVDSEGTVEWDAGGSVVAETRFDAKPKNVVTKLEPPDDDPFGDYPGWEFHALSIDVNGNPVGYWKEIETHIEGTDGEDV